MHVRVCPCLDCSCWTCSRTECVCRALVPELVFSQVGQRFHPMQVGVDDLKVLKYKTVVLSRCNNERSSEASCSYVQQPARGSNTLRIAALVQTACLASLSTLHANSGTHTHIHTYTLPMTQCTSDQCLTRTACLQIPRYPPFFQRSLSHPLVSFLFFFFAFNHGKVWHHFRNSNSSYYLRMSISRIDMKWKLNTGHKGRGKEWTDSCHFGDPTSHFF